MKATVGDRITVLSRHLDEPPREGRILEVHGANDGPPYLVRWMDDEHTALLFPGPDAKIRHQESSEHGDGDTTRQAQYLNAHQTVVEAAAMMRDLGVWALPVCHRDRLCGVISDQDIVRRCVAEGRDPVNRTVAETIMGKPDGLPGTMTVAEVERVMSAFRLWRVPDISEDEKRLFSMLIEADSGRRMPAGRLGEFVRHSLERELEAPEAERGSDQASAATSGIEA